MRLIWDHGRNYVELEEHLDNNKTNKDFYITMDPNFFKVVNGELEEYFK